MQIMSVASLSSTVSSRNRLKDYLSGVTGTNYTDKQRSRGVPHLALRRLHTPLEDSRGWSAR